MSTLPDQSHLKYSKYHVMHDLIEDLILFWRKANKFWINFFNLKFLMEVLAIIGKCSPVDIGVNLTLKLIFLKLSTV